MQCAFSYMYLIVVHSVKSASLVLHITDDITMTSLIASANLVVTACNLSCFARFIPGWILLISGVYQEVCKFCVVMVTTTAHNKLQLQHGHWSASVHLMACKTHQLFYFLVKITSLRATVFHI